MQFYATQPGGLDSDDYKWAKTVWEDFIYWSHTVRLGCDDKDPAARRAHGAKLREIADRFVSTFLERRQAKECTVYFHIMTCHVEVCTHAL